MLFSKIDCWNILPCFLVFYLVYYRHLSSMHTNLPPTLSILMYDGITIFNTVLCWGPICFPFLLVKKQYFADESFVWYMLHLWTLDDFIKINPRSHHCPFRQARIQIDVLFCFVLNLLFCCVLGNWSKNKNILWTLKKIFVLVHSS